MTESNKEIIEQAYASFGAGDIPAALAAFADDIQWVEPDGLPYAGTYVGPQAVLEGVFMRLGEIGPLLGRARAVRRRRRHGHRARPPRLEAQEHRRSGLGGDSPRLDLARRQGRLVPAAHRHRQGPRARLNPLAR